jgi:cell division septal protein FtsQ
VSRVLPDGLRVRVSERVPVAVIRTAAGHFFWVDEDGVSLGEMKASDELPSFFIRGWNEDGTEDARKENVERVRKYRELVREWDALGLSERVSEVTLIDIRDVRAQLAGTDSQIEVRLGSQDAGSRLKIALEKLDVYKQTPRGPSITYVDLQTGRVVIGFASGSKVAAPSNATDGSEAEGQPAQPNKGKKPAAGNDRARQTEAIPSAQKAKANRVRVR